MKISATGKRRFNQLICTNLATPSGFSWNQLEPHNSNSPRIFWTDLVQLQISTLVIRLVLLRENEREMIPLIKTSKKSSLCLSKLPKSSLSLSKLPTFFSNSMRFVTFKHNLNNCNTLLYDDRISNELHLKSGKINCLMIVNCVRTMCFATFVLMSLGVFSWEAVEPPNLRFAPRTSYVCRDAYRGNVNI